MAGERRRWLCGNFSVASGLASRAQSDHPRYGAVSSSRSNPSDG
jgi:hypothetical protein